MFGYVRPLKPELLMREFSRYRSVYCGICKQIGRDYGQLPRVTVGYDLTMLAVLLLSLSDSQPAERLAGCVLNPIARRPVVEGGEILELCAGLSVLMAWHKIIDDVHDERAAAAAVARVMLSRSRRKASGRYPVYARIIAESLCRLHDIEKGSPDPEAAVVFGELLSAVFEQAAALISDDPSIRRAIGLFGRHLGQWIYLADAIDDWARDCNNGSWNPYGDLDLEAARRSASESLTGLELEMDRTAALLPYRRDSGLVANIVTLGLPAVREQILRGSKLPRL